MFMHGMMDNKRVLLVVSGVMLAHSLSLFNGFVDFDDDVIFLNNPLLKAPFEEVISGVFDWSRPDTWRPIRDLSHWFDWKTHRQSAFASHAHNVLLLGLVAYLFRQLLWTWKIDEGLADWVTVIAFIHPVQVEAVAWVSGRKELLAAVFFLLMLGRFHRFLTLRRPYRDGVMTALLFMLGVMSKGHVIVSPIALVAYVFVLRHQNLGPILRSNRGIATLITVMGLMALALAPRIASGGVSMPQWMAADTGHTVLLGDQLQLVYRYLVLIIAPTQLSHIYFTPALDDHYWPTAFVSLGLSIVLIGLVIRWWRNQDARGPIMLIGLSLMLPYLHLKPGVVYMANRYLFLALPFGLLVTFQSVHLESRLRFLTKTTVRGLGVALLLYVLSFSFRHQTTFKDSVSLWTHLTEVYPTSPWGYDRLGRALYRLQDYSAAAGAWLAATERCPDRRKVKYLNNAAVAAMALNRDDMAMSLLEKALVIKSDDETTLSNILIIQKRRALK